MNTGLEILTPVVALVVWSMVMWFWMYATRLPAIKAANIEMDPYAPPGLLDSLPAPVRWKADNYNHLMEQPTIFYALAISLAVLGQGDGINAQLAWGYVGLRVIHSLIQAITNKLELRFTVFALSNVPILILTYNAVCYVLN